MAFESDVVPEDWRSAVIVPLYKGKGERTECSNYRGISLFSVVGEICAGILVERVRKVTEGLIDDKQGRFTLKQISEKKFSVCGFYGPGEGTMISTENV